MKGKVIGESNDERTKTPDSTGCRDGVVFTTGLLCTRLNTYPTGSSFFRTHTSPDTYFYTRCSYSLIPIRRSILRTLYRICKPERHILLTFEELERPSIQAGEHNERGIALLEEGRYDEAIIAFNKAIELNPNYTEVYNNRGNAYYNQRSGMPQTWLPP